MLHVISAEYVDRYRVRVVFNNGNHGVADFAESLDGPVFFPLRDVDYFKTFRIEGHTLSWENGADFAPEYVAELALQQNATEQNHAPKHPTVRSDF